MTYSKDLYHDILKISSLFDKKINSKFVRIRISSLFLMFPLLLARVIGNPYICGNDMFPLEITVPEIVNIDKSLRDISNRTNIRIDFDFGAIMNKIDPVECHTIGQNVSWRFGSITCEARHLMNEKRIRSANQTLINLMNFYSKLIKLNRNEEQIHLNWSTELNHEIQMPPTKEYSSSDLHVLVVARPFAPDAGASVAAHPAAVSKIDGRPNQGMLFLNPEGIPDEPEDHIKPEHLFFRALFHELVHILGMEPTLYSNWLNVETGTQWKDKLPLIHYQDPKYPGKTFHILATPASKRFAQKRWSRTEFAPGIPMGIELEDGGGEYTALSHPESRVYFNEVMVGRLNPPMKISEVVMSLLEDMGWYSLDYSLAEPLTWGSGPLMGASILTDFPVKPPQIGFPRGYQCWDEDFEYELTCMHDYTSGAFCVPPVDVNCPGATGSDDEMFCKSLEFYNPLNLTKRGRSSVFDFINLKSSMNSFGLLLCGDTSSTTAFHNAGTATKYNMSFGQNAGCLKFQGTSNNVTQKTAGCFNMKCSSSKNELLISIGNSVVLCAEGGKVIQIEGNPISSIVCPDPKHVCYANMLNADISLPSSKSAKSIMKYVYIGSGVLLVVIIALIMLLSGKKGKDYQSWAENKV